MIPIILASFCLGCGNAKMVPVFGSGGSGSPESSDQEPLNGEDQVDVNRVSSGTSVEISVLDGDGNASADISQDEGVENSSDPGDCRCDQGDEKHEHHDDEECDDDDGEKCCHDEEKCCHDDEECDQSHDRENHDKER